MGLISESEISEGIKTAACFVVNYLAKTETSSTLSWHLSWTIEKLIMKQIPSDN